jgi:hypothetical protein
MRTMPVPLALFLLLGRLVLALLMSSLRSMFRLPTRKHTAAEGKATGGSGIVHEGRVLRPARRQVQDVRYREIRPLR